MTRVEIKIQHDTRIHPSRQRFVLVFVCCRSSANVPSFRLYLTLIGGTLAALVAKVKSRGHYSDQWAKQPDQRPKRPSKQPAFKRPDVRRWSVP
jgi:hypothetical protein